jgi:histidine ammonia-lyase
MTDRTTIVVDDLPLRVADVVAVARGARLELGPVARERIRASRAVVDAMVEGDELIYGLNTGLGHMRDQRMPVEALTEAQLVTIRTHAGGLGPPLATEVVRAAMTVRVAGMARGGSGISPVAAETYVAMLAAGVHPRVPVTGSVGAGDLMHMAAIALVAIGEGRAVLDGVELTGAEALARAGIASFQPGPKDGLTLVSANGASIGHAALVVDRAARLLDVADVVAAVSLEAAQGNPSIVEPVVAAAKPVAGQAVAASRIRRLLEGSRLCTAGGARSVQDPLSFRVIPQAHGAAREVVRFATDAVDAELAAMDDNPLVSVQQGRMISNGNFHPLLMALAVDAIRPAIAHVTQLADRRTGQHFDAVAGDPEVWAPGAFGRLTRYGSPLLRYASAARTAELRTLVEPATLDVMPLDLGVEDHSTNAPLAVRRTDEALGMAEDVLAAELLTAAARVGWFDGRDRMGTRTRRALDAISDRLSSLGPTAASETVHEAGLELIRGPILDAVGPLDD